VNNAIKKTLILILLTFFMIGTVSAETVTFVVSGSYLSTGDDAYTTKYGGKKYFPEGKLTIRFAGNLYLWGSFGYLRSKYTWEEWSNKGIVLADVDGESISNKLSIAGGLGFYVGYIRPGDFSIKLELGVCNISDKSEDTTSMKATGETLNVVEDEKNGFGFRGNLGVTYGLMKSIFAEISLGYMYAPDKIDDTRVNLGGLRASLGIGLKF
jgi:hypothetical protein